ncbi:hypothetical protein MMSR116_08330 [Methylobacterium mesophilicum SR1.6/6]|uniref:Uncharacterized protein n=1 Tax=Methylobacterium mesophilicum SR1.6/6 TaxID=908290 RepID=A0A6B9FL46_9HYPH|nr:hypothetical protein [Methylobacterium mesophilicum]QGY01884.1 hypothetical protein MMSR116_08330 [Methylobacterium mesophilicum SR1.6/6]
MDYKHDLTLSEQRRLLSDRMQALRSYDLITRSQSVEALARSRELLRVPVYRRPKLSKAG